MDQTESPKSQPRPAGADLHSQLESFQGQIQAAAQQARESQSRLDTALREIGQLKAEKASLLKERDEMRDEALAAIEEDEKEMAALRGQLAGVLERNNRLQSEEEKWSREKQNHAASLHALEQLLKEARTDREKLQSDSSRHNEEIDQLRRKLEQAAVENRKLAGEKAGADGALQKSQETVAALRSELAPLQKAVVELDAKLKQSEQALGQSRAENAQWKTRIREFEEKQAAQQKQLEEDFRRSLREKEEVLSNRAGELEAAQKAHLQLQDRLQLNQREMESVRLEKKQLEENLMAARENSEAAARARAALGLKEQEIGAKETENRQLRQQQETAGTKLAEMELLLVGIRAEKDRLAEAVEKVREDASGQLRSALAAKDSEIHELQSRLDARTRELDLARKQEEARRQALEVEEEKNRNFERQITRLRAQIQDEEADWQQALDTVEKFRTQAQLLEEKKQALESDLLVRQRELSARQQEGSVLKDQLQTLQGTLSMMQSELLQQRQPVQPSRETDWILSGISILAQQARSGNTDLKGVLKAWLAESDRDSRQPSATPVPSSAPIPDVPAWSRPAVEAVQITPPHLIPGASPVFGTTGHHLRQLEQVDLPGDMVLSLDELRCAVLDPVWRDKWKDGEKPNPFIGPSAACRGKAEEIFYLTARDFLDWLVQPEGVNDPARFSEKELWQYMYELFAAERLDRLVQRNDFEGTNFLSRRLRLFCRRLAALKERSPAGLAWDEVLRAGQRKISRVVFPLDQRRLVVHGALYGLRLHPGETAEIADWSVLAEAGNEAALTDLALHVLVFHKAFPESGFSACVENYDQEFSVREVSRDELNRALRTRVVPAFYDLAGMPKPAGIEESKLDFFPLSHAVEILHG